jgi:hypothetical protein
VRNPEERETSGEKQRPQASPSCEDHAPCEVRERNASLDGMSTLGEIESAVLELPPNERARFVQWLDEHRRELLPADTEEMAGNIENAEVQRREVLRRRDELMANAALAQRFDDDYFTRLRNKIADVRVGKASAG